MLFVRLKYANHKTFPDIFFNYLISCIIDLKQAITQYIYSVSSVLFYLSLHLLTFRTVMQIHCKDENP